MHVVNAVGATVENDGDRQLASAQDAIGICHWTCERLSSSTGSQLQHTDISSCSLDAHVMMDGLLGSTDPLATSL